MTKSLDVPESNADVIAASEVRLRALLIATSDVIYSMSADWRVMRELDGRGFLKDAKEPTIDWKSNNVHPEDLDKVNAAIDEAIKEKKIFQLEHRVLRVDGTPGWTFSRAVPILDDQDQIIEWFGTASDITERKNTEEALRISRVLSDQQKRVYETITSNTPDLMYVFDLNYRFTYANSALLSMWGKTWDTAIGKKLLENGYEPWHAEMHEREIDQIIKTKQPIRGEVSFPHAILGRRVYDYILTPVLNEQGEVEAVAGTTRDITERKQWEEALATGAEELQAINEEMAATNEELAASNEVLTTTNEKLALVNQELLIAKQKVEEAQAAFRLAVSAANFGTWFIHSVTREFITDARLKELFGYYPEEPLSIEQATAQITEEYRDYASSTLENAIYNNGDYDITYPVIGFHDHKLRWLRAIGNLKVDPSGTFSAFTGVVMDITEQHLAAAEIKHAEENLRMAIDAAGLGTYYINAAERIFVVSAKLKEFFGYFPEDEVTYDAAINQIHPDYRQEVVNSIESAFTKGTRFDMEYPIIGYHDGKTRWVRGIGEVQHREGTNYFTGLIHEITEKKLDEIRKNDFIGMVSHELKTPLTSMKGYIQLLLVKLKKQEDDFFIGALEKANGQVTKMTSMINGFLNLSRLESGKIHIDLKKFDLALLVKEVELEFLATTLGHQLLFEPIESSFVNADREKIGQVIHNLISNAIKYSPSGSSISIACYSANGLANISIKDHGMGIKSDDLPKIFDRYYRVEGNHMFSISGFGIGLYLCSEIINRHEGKIWAESEFGKGSTFGFSLAKVYNQ
ncbi:PAS domain S-box protein [Pedobacter cryoconitis]|uniref:PAS domain S-box protein n=1 Tax=Pedobacter cryoconitis TaxID=188932 RepID=UPI00180BCF4E|nr:PAS domain S-box protein [Pedobacter cryoconitis]MBB5645928.1 PAS domain S-box-containing protein [Pedobacter cryoconitis]